MNERTAKMQLIQQGWKKLKRLHAIPIDLSRRALIHELDRDELTKASRMEALLLALGLNDEGLEEFPADLHQHCGQGLRIWQYPNQFSRYLVALSRMQVESYMEIGVRHGGAFVATVEYLERFRPLRFALGIDIVPCPSLLEYHRVNPRATFVHLNTESEAFRRFLEDYDEIDLVFIDSFHGEHQLREEFRRVEARAKIVGFHDIVSTIYPGVRKVWQEVKRTGAYECHEFTDQYRSDGTTSMGIGLAVKHKQRTP